MERPVRQKKATEIINIENTVKEFSVPDGSGTKLQDMAQVVENLTKYTGGNDELKKIHSLFYRKVGKKMEIKQNILQFNGVDKTLEKEKVVDDVFARCGKWQKKFLCDVMDILTIDRSSKTGDVSKDGLLERLALWIMKPEATTKKFKSAKSTSKKRKSTGKKTPTKVSSAKKKQKVSKKKTLIDSDSDEEDLSMQDVKDREQIKIHVKKIIAIANMDEMTLKQLRNQVEGEMGKKLKKHVTFFRDLVVANTSSEA